MNYVELSLLLLRLSQETTQHHHELEGLALARAAESLEKAALRYQKKLEDFIGGRGPGFANWRSFSPLRRPKAISSCRP